MASSTRSTFVGFVSAATRPSSSMSSWSTCRRPAVSRITTSRPSFRAASSPSRAAFTGSARSSANTGIWIWRPSWSSWSTAAGRWRSHATRPGRFPSFRRRRASLAAAVVLPDPCRPARRITVGGRANARRESPVPMSSVSSSWTIFTTCWPGVRLLRTSCPSARSLTDAVKSRATSRLTSASSSARRISRIAFDTASSSRLPLRPRPPRVAWSLSESVSNTGRTVYVEAFGS